MKHSSAADNEQTATMFLLPNLRVKTGPHLFESIAITLCIGGFETREDIFNFYMVTSK
jgi:hypothetical protein